MEVVDNGKNNSIEALNLNTQNIWIGVHGNGNKVILCEGIIVADSLSIYIDANNCTVSVGKNSTFEYTDISIGENNGSVIIGEDCMFAKKTTILASDFHSVIDSTTGKRLNYMRRGVTLGNHVWVGYGSYILKDVSIGSDSIIGAHSTVTKNFGPGVVVAGSPAIVVRESVSWVRPLIGICAPEAVGSELAKIHKATVNTKMKFFIERISDTSIEGWAFLEGISSDLSDVYLQLLMGNSELTILPASKLTRVDVSDHFGNNDYLQSGFILNGKFDTYKIRQVRVIIKDGNDYYISPIL